ncbi:Coenzyme F420-reducing hydrogenase, alpha subunit [Candidatus Kryptonium thompsonii]|uniref:Coenzyme F420-reducing hydrogenase, alpha subunit n=1 Tax=Candidatus Kryptonium thompsonii TaxID=1633631 RepID=A0A0P1LUY9_9BACT|nr:Ni/Fe hydrogenase subunit alpha [Candidatus Kryptonium thompsoni]CUS80845.1 Coenzyme F420-reducing hydrogenase, alpha subunit [Candidatus Kryptonium thompsoni]CUS84100.1 Coenzyme F420-reducing hydrogenase, alpha subunit [Candidatus Kryptonium thompsoni]CUS84448.1 Coenzyme F420-reducing hydrogenase, alpha subunit [Candidatus Kryptonium thompsoni]CUS86297.1 Coenzyme F420-reducing hydrogenase, alpha subunit [Candidatus Kryptonium thompsoni]CUS90016.1 Coenzyme F420-reducing hydrogenase, alpha s
MKDKAIKVDYLARVEGEGALYIKVKNGYVVDVKVKIFEPPRFFEAFLRGRSFREVPDITARICGICPVAYQMSSIHAIEGIFGVKVTEQIRMLRRLIYCGEWIESHALHIFMLHLPDFLGYDDVIQMAKDYPDTVQKALRLKKIGNEIIRILGGREIHPINLKVGGFYKLPSKKELRKLEDDLKWARDFSIETVKFLADLEFPEFEQDYEFVALRHPNEYPLNEGRIVSNKGLDISVNEYDNHFVEEHVPHSNALHSMIVGRGAYFVGPLARFNLNFDKLSDIAKEIALEVNFKPVCKNPFKSILARAVETLYACDESLRIISEYDDLDKPFVDFSVKPGIGYGCTEAPRGILYHRYKVDEKGTILDAKIVPPTSQNLKMMESDLWKFVATYLNLPEDELTWKCEQAIRNYDPCISCATHFLKLYIERE